MFLLAAATGALTLGAAEAWVLPPTTTGRTALGRTALRITTTTTTTTTGRARQHAHAHARRGAGALKASLLPLLSDTAALEHTAALLQQHLQQPPHDATGTALFYLADTDLSSLTDSLPDASELLKSMPKLDDFKDSLPKLPDAPPLPSQLQDALKVGRQNEWVKY
jgi:hypothetical protein